MLKVRIVAVGRPGRVLAAAIDEYEQRARHYWNLEIAEVKEERARKGATDDAVRDAEAERILQRIPDGYDVTALTRAGDLWPSTRLSAHLADVGLRGGAGAAFIIGGAIGLGRTVLARAQRQLALSSFTLPHELARLVLTEQLYRAGTIARGEPYHKGAE